MNRKFKITTFIFVKKIVKVFGVTFDQFNASLLNNTIFFKNDTDPKLLNGIVTIFKHPITTAADCPFPAISLNY